MKTIDKIEDYLSEAIPVRAYQKKWNIEFIGKKVTPIFLDHRDDLDITDKKLIQMEKRNHYTAMAKLEKGVLNALSKMDARQAFWEKFLKEKGL